jgi:hypothetical protein
MWLPNKNLVIDKNRYSEGEKVMYKDKNGQVHEGTVKTFKYKGLIDGWVYGIELDEPLNGVKNYFAKEDKICGFEQVDRYKKLKFENKNE